MKAEEMNSSDMQCPLCDWLQTLSLFYKLIADYDDFLKYLRTI